jgi:transposase
MRFALGLRADLPTMEASLKLPYSNVQIEGHAIRLKLIKRKSYGRDKLDLLEARVLHATGLTKDCGAIHSAHDGRINQNLT